MLGAFTTVIAPLIEVLRPGEVLIAEDEDGPLLDRGHAYAAAWDARVRRLDAHTPLDALAPGTAAILDTYDAGMLERIVAVPEVALVFAGGDADPARRPLIEDLAARSGLDVLRIPGLSSVYVIRCAELPPAAAALLDELRLAPAALAHVDALVRWTGETRGAVQSARARTERLETLDADHEQLVAETAELRTRVRELAERITVERTRAVAHGARAIHLERTLRTVVAARTAAGRPPIGERGDGMAIARAGETDAALIREQLDPEALLEALGWGGEAAELARPIPRDVRQLIIGGRTPRVAVDVGDDGLALRETVASVADRAGRTLGVELRLGEAVSAEAVVTARRLTELLPGARLADRRARADHTLAAGELLPWGWPYAPDAAMPSVVYVIRDVGVHAEGSPETVAEIARTLRSAGAGVRIAVPRAQLPAAAERYGNADQLFVPFDDGNLLAAVSDADVIVATSPLEPEGDDRLVVLLHDYAPLSAPAGSAESDHALLAFHELGDRPLGAVGHWLPNIVAARHNDAVVSLPPAVRTPFRRVRARERERAIGIAAFVDPARPATRPVAALQILRMIERSLGDRVQTFTFGGEPAEVRALGEAVGSEAGHLGPLTAQALAELFARCELVIDPAAHQPDPQFALEALAARAVPVVPRLGAAIAPATAAASVLVVPDDSDEAYAGVVLRAVRDRQALAARAAAGREVALGASVEVAAQAQLGWFTDVHRERQVVPSSEVRVGG